MTNFKKKFLAVFCLVPCLSAVDDVAYQQGISSNFVNTVQVLLSKKDDVKLIENNLQLIQSGVDNIVSRELVEIDELRGVQIVAVKTKEKVIEARSSLESVEKDLKSASYIVDKFVVADTEIKDIASFDQFLSGMGISIYLGMDQSEITKKIHEKLTENPPSFDVYYTGYVGYFGDKDYSGKVSYSGSVTCNHKEWNCKNCKKVNAFVTGETAIKNCSSCGGSTSYYSHFLDKKPKEIIANSAKANYFGSELYSGKVSYEGSEHYSGKTATKCMKDHHGCSCGKWASMILGFRQVLEEKEFYKNAFEKQKFLIESMGQRSEQALKIMKDVIPQFDSINDKGQLAISTIQSERQHFLSGLKDQKEKAIFAFKIMNRLHENESGFKDQLLTIVKTNEQEQKQEKIRLQEDLRRMEESRSVQVQNIVEQTQSLTKDIIAQNNNKDNKLEEERRQKEKLKDEVREKDIESTKKEADLSNDKNAFINFLPALLNANVDKEKLEMFLADIEEEKFSFKDLIKEIKKFMLKKENKIGSVSQDLTKREF